MFAFVLELLLKLVEDLVALDGELFGLTRYGSAKSSIALAVVLTSRWIDICFFHVTSAQLLLLRASSMREHGAHKRLALKIRRWQKNEKLSIGLET